MAVIVQENVEICNRIDKIPFCRSLSSAVSTLVLFLTPISAGPHNNVNRKDPAHADAEANETSSAQVAEAEGGDQDEAQVRRDIVAK